MLTHDRIQRRRTRRDYISEEEIEAVKLSPSPPQQGGRVWRERNIHEVLLATGWSSFAGEAWAHLGLRIDFTRLFSIEMLMATREINGRHLLEVTRIYPCRIEIDTCERSHRCAILNVLTENNPPLQERRALELLLEEKCECFWDGDATQEGRLVLYAW